MSLQKDGIGLHILAGTFEVGRMQTVLSTRGSARTHVPVGHQHHEDNERFCHLADLFKRRFAAIQRTTPNTICSVPLTPKNVVFCDGEYRAQVSSTTMYISFRFALPPG